MVKNLTGGNKSKGFARKNTFKNTSSLRISQEESEIYAQATKMLGGSMCHVVDLDGKQYLCHIRGKFKGKGKRDNFIKSGTWLLVGLREWEKEIKSKLLNCDVIEVYSDSDKEKIKNTIIGINWNLFINNDMTNTGSSSSTDIEKEDGFVFMDDATQEYHELIASHIALLESNKDKLNVIVEEEEYIDVDNI